MEAKSAIRVGIVTLVGLVIAVALLLYLSHVRTNDYLVKVDFDDTMGLTGQSVVRMQGVPIGVVQKIALDTSRTPFRPQVTLSIDNKYSIPSNYRISIVSGLLITTPQVIVEPPDKSGTIGPPLPKNNTALVQGAPPQSPLASLSPGLSEGADQLGATMKDLRGKLNRVTGKLNVLLDDTDRLVKISTGTIQSTKSFLTDPTMKSDLTQTLHNFKIASANTAEASGHLSKELTLFLKNGNNRFNHLSDATTNLVVKLGNTVDDAREVVKKLTDQATNPRLQRSLQETLDLGRSTLASVRQITSDLHQITGDPQVASSLKETVSNLASATKKADSAMDKIDTLLDRVSGKGKSALKVKLPQTGVSADVSEQLNPGKFRMDVNGYIAINPHNRLILGLYDLGQDTRLNLQMGDEFAPNVTARYGLHAGSLGLGLDYNPPGSFAFETDLFDPNHLRLDVKAFYKVNKSAAFWLGADGILRHTVPLIGVRVQP